MITNKRIFFTGIALLIVPLLGFTLFWKFFLVIFFGLFLVSSSVKITLPKSIDRYQFTKGETHHQQPTFSEEITYVPLQESDYRDRFEEIKPISSVRTIRKTRIKHTSSIEEPVQTEEMVNDIKPKSRSRKTKSSETQL